MRALTNLDRKVERGFAEGRKGDRRAIRSELFKVAMEASALSERLQAGEGRKQTWRAYSRLLTRAAEIGARAEQGNADAETSDQIERVRRLMEEVGAYYEPRTRPGLADRDERGERDRRENSEPDL